MNKALIVVDIQLDFTTGGSLAVEFGDQVAQDVTHWIEYNQADDLQTYSLIVGTKDWHVNPENHFSDTPDYVNTWPPHCVAGTPGAEFHPNLDDRLIDVTVRKGHYSAAYSGFEGYAASGAYYLDDLLQIDGITNVDICGIATDYCVQATAIDAVNYGYTTTVLLPLTAAVKRENVLAVAEDMLEHGIRVVTEL